MTNRGSQGPLWSLGLASAGVALMLAVVLMVLGEISVGLPLLMATLVLTAVFWLQRRGFDDNSKRADSRLRVGVAVVAGVSLLAAFVIAMVMRAISE
jgi:hypothetical protein